jgi:tetratricopeptide (TPR) repeat protein
MIRPSTLTCLLPDERIRLAGWAAELAYEINDFRNCQKLLEQIAARSVVHQAMLAFCLIENGHHEDAAKIANVLRMDQNRPAQLCGDLVEAGIHLDTGAWKKCRAALARIVAAEAREAPAIAAHAYRLISEVDDEPDATTAAVESGLRYRQANLTRSSAYSDLSAATFLARAGRIAEATAMIDSAEQALVNEVRNEHIILNNRAFVLMLAEQPDFQTALTLLRRSMRLSRNDFADLSILANLSIVHLKTGALSDALDCVRRGVVILDQPEFFDRDIFWPVCFNFSKVLDASGDAHGADVMRKRPYAVAWEDRSFADYWAWLYGETDKAGASLQYMLRFDYHPCALSHWQLDGEALRSLMREARG